MTEKTPHTDQRETSSCDSTRFSSIDMGDLPRAFRRDLEDVYHFYLDDKAREELAGMGKTSRWFYMIAWLLKNSFLKLSPVRRILLVASVIFFLEGAFNQINIGALIVGFAMLAFILLLELKDKLLAQDELQAGRAVQFALMPKDNPKFRGWDAWVYTRPANDVGGDLVDYIPVRENSLGVVLGDVEIGRASCRERGEGEDGHVALED